MITKSISVSKNFKGYYFVVDGEKVTLEKKGKVLFSVTQKYFKEFFRYELQNK